MVSKVPLRIVLVLTFIGSGCSFISYMAVGLFHARFVQVVDVLAQSMGEEYAIALETLTAMPRLLFVSMGLFYGISLLGAIWMWRLRRSGFHFYTLSQLVLLALPAIFMGRDFFPLGEAMMTLLFVGFYYFTLRRLGVFSNDIATSDSDSVER